MPTLHYVEMAIQNAMVEGEDFNRRLGRRASLRYPIRWKGRDFSAPAIFEESHRLYSEEAQVPLSIPRYLGGVRSPSSVGRMLAEIDVPIFDLRENRFVDLNHPDYAMERSRSTTRVPAPDDLVMSADDEEESERLLTVSTMDELRIRFSQMQAACGLTPSVVERLRRSALVVAIVLGRANGQCEACRSPAPFRRVTGSPYLEVHHIEAMSEGGPDDPANCAAVCPNCHRAIHFGPDGSHINKLLGFDAFTHEAFRRYDLGLEEEA